MSDGQVSVQTRGGQWETIGVDRDPGIVPEGLGATWSPWGPDALNFGLRRDPGRDSPDLEAYTPVRWTPDGSSEPTWSGFAIETPGAGAGPDASLSVQCLGWQYHLDDDPYAAQLILNDLTRWQDTRTFPCNPTHLTRFVAAAQVSNGNGGLAAIFPKGYVYAGTELAGVTFDQGPDPALWATQYDLDTAGVGIVTGFNIYLRQHDTIEDILAGTGARTDTLAGVVVVGSRGGALTGSRRYVSVLLNRSGGAATAAGDEGVQITNLVLYRSSAYRGGSGNPTLKVSQIIADALPHAPLIDQSTADVAATALVMQGAEWRELRTAREVMDGFNAYHRYRLGLNAATPPRLRFQPQPTRATIKVETSRPGVRWVDASINSGRDVYNEVNVTGTSGAGVPLAVTRTAIALCSPAAAAPDPSPSRSQAPPTSPRSPPSATHGSPSTPERRSRAPSRSPSTTAPSTSPAASPSPPASSASASAR
jgi:hypothetical protein